MKILRIKYPIEFELNPKQVDIGTHWITLTLKNISNKTLKRLDINLNSLDTYSIVILGTGKYLSDLKPNEEEIVPFKVSATATGKLYAFIKGGKNGEDFSWTSLNMPLKVGRPIAELRTLFAMTPPYPTLETTLKCEATLVGLEQSDGLNLQLWAETPLGKFEELANIKTKSLNAGEEATYTTEITPKEEGYYTIHAYLYDGKERIGHETDVIWVQK